ncbi:MAG: Hsp20/alpha crystallin family protein [Nitrososphaerales archaeon]
MGSRRVRGRQGNDSPSTIMLAVMIIGVIVIGVILMLLVRVQRGLLGIVLAALASGLLIYWLREVRTIVKKEFSGPVTKSKTEWEYDLLEMKDEVTLVADVPGPQEEIKVQLEGEKLEIRGGNNFFKTVTLPKILDILNTNYLNGVLEVKLKRATSK